MKWFLGKYERRIVSLSWLYLLQFNADLTPQNNYEKHWRPSTFMQKNLIDSFSEKKEMGIWGIFGSLGLNFGKPRIFNIFYKSLCSVLLRTHGPPAASKNIREIQTR